MIKKSLILKKSADRGSSRGPNLRSPSISAFCGANEKFTKWPYVLLLQYFNITHYSLQESTAYRSRRNSLRVQYE